MKLPNHDRAVIPREKLTDYLLSLTHEDGRPKALFFIGVGFSTGQWESLASALRRHAAAHEVTGALESVFGTRYIIVHHRRYPGNTDWEDTARSCRLVH